MKCMILIGVLTTCLLLISVRALAADYILIPDGQLEESFKPVPPSQRPVWRTNTSNYRPYWMVYSSDRENLIKWGCTNCQVNAIRIEQRNHGYKTPWTPEQVVDPTLLNYFRKNNLANNWPQKLKEAEEWLGIHKPYLGQK